MALDAAHMREARAAIELGAMRAKLEDQMRLSNGLIMEVARMRAEYETLQMACEERVRRELCLAFEAVLPRIVIPEARVAASESEMSSLSSVSMSPTSSVPSHPQRLHPYERGPTADAPTQMHGRPWIRSDGVVVPHPMRVTRSQIPVATAPDQKLDGFSHSLHRSIRPEDSK